MANKGSYLVNGKFLAADDFLVSSNGQFIAYMQADNDFVLYHADPTASTPTPDWNRPYWSSGTVLGLSSCYATLQSTGEFVLCSGTDPSQTGETYWTAGPIPGDGQYYALLQDTSDLVLCSGTDPSQSTPPYWTALPQIATESKFMRNYRESAPVNGGKDVATIRTPNGQTELFTIGNDGNVYNFAPDSTSETGFGQLAITQNLNVVAIAADLDSAGEMTVFAADNGPRLWYVKQDPSTATGWDPDKLLSLSVPPASNTISRIVTRNINNTLYIAVIWACSGGTYTATCAIWNGDATSFHQIPTNYPILNTNMVWTGTTTDNIALRTFYPDGKIYDFAFESNKAVPAIVTPNLDVISANVATNASGTDDIVAILTDNNLYRLTGGSKGASGFPEYTWMPLFQAVTADQPLAFPAVEVIAEADANQNIQIFTVSKPSQAVEGDPTYYNVLYHWLPQADSATGYSFPPVALTYSNGMQVASESNGHGTMDLFVVDASSTNINHLYQDDVTTDWNIQRVEIAGGDTIIPYVSYATDITIYDNAGELAVGYPVTLWSSGTERITINGFTYFVDPHRIVTVNTNSAGMLSIATETGTVATSLLEFTIPQLMMASDTIIIEPSADVHTQLATVTGDELYNAMMTDDAGNTSYLIPDQYRTTDTTTQTAQAINNSIALANTPAPGAMPLPNSRAGHGVHRSAWYRRGGSPHDLGKIDPAKATKHWRLSFADGQVVYEELIEEEARAIIAEKQARLGATSMGIKSWFTSLGDAVKSVVNKIIDVFDVTFSGINAAIEFIVDGVHYLFTTVIEVIQQAFDVVELIFAKIQVFFEMIFEWLGWLFIWQNILRSKNAIAYTFQQFLGFMAGAAQQMKTLVDNGFQSFADSVDDLLNQGIMTIAGPSTIGGYIQTYQQNNATLNKASSNNFIYNEFTNNGSSGTTSYTFQPGTTLEDFMQQLSDFADFLTSTGAFADAATYFTNLGGSPDNIFRQLLAGLFKVMQGIIDVGFYLTKAIIDTLLDMMVQVIAGIQSFLTAKWKIPFLSAFYKFITQGSDLTTLDLACLITAIPTTFVYKLSWSEYPFPTDNSLSDFKAAFNSTVMLQASGLAAPSTQVTSSPAIPLTDKQAKIIASFYLGTTIIGSYLTALTDAMPANLTPKVLTGITYATIFASFGFSFPWFFTQGELDCAVQNGLGLWTYVVDSFIAFVGAIAALGAAYKFMKMSRDTTSVILCFGGIAKLAFGIAASTGESDGKKIAYMIVPTIPLMAKPLRMSTIKSPYGVMTLAALDVTCGYTTGVLGYLIFQQGNQN